MISRRILETLVLGSLPLVGAACGHSPAPRELVDARGSYERARTGPAREVAPVQLDNARLALQEAEEAYMDEPDEPRTRDLAYIAHRRSMMAEAQANIALNDQRKERAQRERDMIQSRALSSTQRELAEHRQRLAGTQQQLVAGQTALEQERAARTQAERTAAAAIASLREVAQVREEQRGLVITLSGAVLFASNESSLLPIAQQKLDQVAETLRDHSGQNIVVEGHTDSRGSRRRNEELSLMRAQAVRDYLVTKGVTADTIRAVGIGPARPVADNATPEGRANNRRVEIVVQPAAGGGAAPAPR